MSRSLGGTMSADQSCIFCGSWPADAPAHRVSEDERALAFMDLFPPARDTRW
jgi:hypothetical protein